MIVLKDGRVHHGSRKKHQVQEPRLWQKTCDNPRIKLEICAHTCPNSFFPHCVYWDDTMSVEFYKLYDKIVTDLQWQNDLWKCWSGFSIKSLDSLWCHCPVGHKSDVTEETSLGAHPKLCHLLEAGEGGRVDEFWNVSPDVFRSRLSAIAITFSVLPSLLKKTSLSFQLQRVS